MNRNLLTQTDARGCITTLSYDGLNRLTDKVYSGSRIAMRVGNNRSTLPGDHPGSTSITANSSTGALIGELRYKAWGEQRYSSGTTHTMRHFTGQYQEDLLGGTEGLYYFNARWVDVYLNRWTSPDSIVSNLYNPLELDRYAYARNNPVRYVDPSGHLVCSDPHVAEGDCSDEGAGLWRYNITLYGKWTKVNRLAAREAAYAVGSKFTEDIDGTPWEAFKEVYGYVNLTWGLEGAKGECATITAGGCTTSAHQINFMSLAKPVGRKTAAMAAMEARNNVVHELGHAFADLWYPSGSTYDPRGPYSNIDQDLLVEGGFHESPVSARLMWRQHPGDTGPHELFADMFLGWTFNSWGTDGLGGDRSEFMTTHMTEWIE